MGTVLAVGGGSLNPGTVGFLVFRIEGIVVGNDDGTLVVGLEEGMAEGSRDGCEDG